MLKIGTLIFLIIGLQSTFSFFNDGTRQVCVRSPKKMDFNSPIKRLWEGGKIFFSKDPSLQCKGRRGTLRIKVIDYKDVKKPTKFKTHDLVKLVKLNKHQQISIQFNDTIATDHTLFAVTGEPILRIEYESIINGTVTNPTFRNIHLRRKPYDGIRIIGSCVMMCVEVEYKYQQELWHCFFLNNPLKGL
nr:MAG: hypothetical protein [Porcellio scaber clopovirus]